MTEETKWDGIRFPRQEGDRGVPLQLLHIQKSDEMVSHMDIADWMALLLSNVSFSQFRFGLNHDNADICVPVNIMD